MRAKKIQFVHSLRPFQQKLNNYQYFSGELEGFSFNLSFGVFPTKTSIKRDTFFPETLYNQQYQRIIKPDLRTPFVA